MTPLFTVFFKVDPYILSAPKKNQKIIEFRIGALYKVYVFKTKGTKARVGS
jgi:hypothetical protein